MSRLELTLGQTNTEKMPFPDKSSKGKPRAVACGGEYGKCRSSAGNGTFQEVLLQPGNQMLTGPCGNWSFLVKVMDAAAFQSS